MTADAGAGGRSDVVGLVPAAGTASRIQPIPCSKEVLPLGFRPDGPEGRLRPRAAAETLLEAMDRAGAGRAYVVLRTGKWDVPAFLEDGGPDGPALAYLVTPGTAGVPFTVEAALPFLAGSRVVFGFPDIVFEPPGALERLIERQEERGADVVLGLFPAERPEKMDMVRLDSDGAVRSLVIKPDDTELRHTWILAAWTPAFTEFLAGWCRRERERRADPEPGPDAPEEPYLGHVVQAALEQGIEVDAVVFEEGSYVDIGTPRELASAMAERVGPGSDLAVPDDALDRHSEGREADS